MDAEERKARVGNGVNEIPHQMLPFRADLVILATKRQDAHLATLARERRHAVRVQAGAGDEEIRLERAGGRLRHPRGA